MPRGLPLEQVRQAAPRGQACCRAPSWRRRALAELAALDDAAFRELFAGSPVKRIGRDRFVRNVLIAIGNAPPGDRQLTAAACRCLDDRSPLVRAAAVWAFTRLASITRREAERARRLTREEDPLVRQEWERDISS